MLRLVVFVLSIASCASWYNFNFRLENGAKGMDDFPLKFDSILRDLATIAGFTKEQSLGLSYQELMEKCTGFPWDDVLQKYFARENIPEGEITYLRATNISTITLQMPKYDFDSFWDAPMKEFVFRTAFYMTTNGTEETLKLLQTIYIKHDDGVLKEINGFRKQHTGAKYVQSNVQSSIYKQIGTLIEILQFNETSEFIKGFDITPLQLTYLTRNSFDTVNKAISRLIYYNLHRDQLNIEDYHQQVLRIVSKIQLHRTSIYEWSANCVKLLTEVDYETETLDTISERCFDLPFSRTAFTLYGVSSAQAESLVKFNMAEASIVANSTFQQISLQPAKDFIEKMLKGVKQIEQSESLPFIEFARSTFITWEKIKTSSIGVTLSTIQKLPWPVLNRAYALTSSVAVQVNSILFQQLDIVLESIAGDFKLTEKRLRTLSTATIFKALENQVSESFIRAEYKTNVLTLSGKRISTLRYLFNLNQATMQNSSLVNISEEVFGLRIEEFIQYNNIPPASAEFFTKTTIRDFASLLVIDVADVERFTITQILEKIKPEWTFADAMLISPKSFYETNADSLDDALSFSLPQIVDIYHKEVQSAQSFANYITVWSKSEEVSRIIKTSDLKALATRLQIQASILADMKIIDIVNTVMVSFGEVCDPQKKYCRALQVCTQTPLGHRCRCENGYRYSKENNCVDLNECLFANVTCDGNAVCENTDGSYRCLCSLGYKGDGETCEDINECALQVHECHQNATCIDTKGSYRCECNPGYEGNGRECVDIDECQTNGHKCHRNADCRNLPGTFDCACKLNYAGDGVFSCTDVNECEDGTDDCPSNSVCHNTQGSHECICVEPFKKGEDGLCHECTSSDTENCGDDAICLGNRCSCEDGYRGDGKKCQDINECTATINACGKGRCINTKGSFTCNCVNGYRSAHITKKCLDVDECNEPNGHLLCNGTGETCTNTNGGYACVTVKSDKAVRVALGIAIPLIILMFIAMFVVYFLHRRHQGRKELNNFDTKLKQMYTNKAFEKDETLSQVSSASERPIAGLAVPQKSNFLSRSKTLKMLFAKPVEDEKRPDY